VPISAGGGTALLNVFKVDVVARRNSFPHPRPFFSNSTRRSGEGLRTFSRQ
jgi:hypothetical protein